MSPRAVPDHIDEGHLHTIDREFGRQAESFNASAVANADELLRALVERAQPQPDERWLDAACGPGIIARRFATVAGSVHGVDVTARMIQTARAEATAAGLDNVSFEVADATATGLPAASFDGAVTRFSVHHIPVASRLFDELARVVRPGGTIVVLDQVADDDPEDRSWSQEVERLRDPSHWISLSPAAMRSLGERAGLTLRSEQRFGFELDFDDWLRRGTDDAASHALVERALELRPGGTERFAVTHGASGRLLRLEMWLGAWSRPAAGREDPAP